MINRTLGDNKLIGNGDAGTAHEIDSNVNSNEIQHTVNQVNHTLTGGIKLGNHKAASVDGEGTERLSVMVPPQGLHI